MRRRPAAHLLRSEGGFALTEALVASTLLIVVLSAVLVVIESAVRQAPRDQERAHVVREAQVGLHQMTRELRQTYALVGTPTAQSLEARVNVLGTDRRVRYRCDVAHPTRAATFRCNRELLNTSTGALVSSSVVIDGISSSSVFTYTPTAATASHVTAQVALPAKGELSEGLSSNVVLSDGFRLRNLGV